MTDTLRELLKQHDAASHAIDAGTHMHEKMRHVFIDGDSTRGDTEIIKKIAAHKELLQFFDTDSQTEVPVAGFVHGKFISRRIDRMVISHDAKTIMILDYKTDTNPDEHRTAYHAQVTEYMELLRMIYPKYTVRGFILWLHNFELESVQ
ncbi:MAG: PD-(D/E)XK nuclease family protein [Pseudomonadota bacterium]|nr:PD-(D/E)XK nuclease family protein [Pseudomonadota bacterium]